MAIDHLKFDVPSPTTELPCACPSCGHTALNMLTKPSMSLAVGVTILVWCPKCRVHAKQLVSYAELMRANSRVDVVQVHITKMLEDIHSQHGLGNLLEIRKGEAPW